MEFLCKLMVKEYKAFAMRMQHDCLCLYSSIAKSRQNEYYYDDCALGYALASEFYLNIGETEKAVEKLQEKYNENSGVQLLCFNNK